MRRIFCAAALLPVFAGCVAPAKVVHEPPTNWYCTKVDGRGETGENVECRSVVIDAHGDTIYDGPPVPPRALDPTPRPPRTGWNKFCWNWCGVLLAVPLTGLVIWDVHHAYNKD